MRSVGIETRTWPLYGYVRIPIVLAGKVWVPRSPAKWVTQSGELLDPRGCKQWGRHEWMCYCENFLMDPCRLHQESVGDCVLDGIFNQTTVVVNNAIGCLCVASVTPVIWNDGNISQAPVRKCRCNATVVESGGAYLCTTYLFPVIGYGKDLPSELDIVLGPFLGGHLPTIRGIGKDD